MDGWAEAYGVRSGTSDRRVACRFYADFLGGVDPSCPSFGDGSNDHS